MATSTFTIPNGSLGTNPLVSCNLPTDASAITLPATTTSVTITLVCSGWANKTGGTLWWQVQYWDGATWQILSAQGAEAGKLPPFVATDSSGIPFGALGKGGVMPSVEIRQAGMGGLVVRGVIAASQSLTAGATVTILF